MRLKPCFAQCFVLVLVGGAVFAQQDMGVITGVVTDQSGAVVADAHVVATDTETNEARTVETLSTGAYSIGPLRIGTYDVSVEKPGFKKEVWKGIILHAQDRVRVDLKLTLGQVAETIAVTGEAPILEAESATLSNVVNEKEVRQLPLNGRNFQQLAWLSAGVYSNTQGRDQTSGFNANGQQNTENNFIMDGVDNNNNVMGMQDRKAQVIVPSLDAVSEFKVMTSNYSAEFGRNSGAVMIVSIKSGGNDFHGTAFEYLRNNYFDSRNTFSAATTKLRQDQYGGTVGGPVIRNRTFFFASYERFQQSNGQTLTGIVPTDAEKQGIFPTIAGHDQGSEDRPAVSRKSDSNIALRYYRSEVDPVMAGAEWRGRRPDQLYCESSVDSDQEHHRCACRSQLLGSGQDFRAVQPSGIEHGYQFDFRRAGTWRFVEHYSINTNPAYSVAFSYTIFSRPR